MSPNRAYPFSIAPMMDWTDRHCRMFHRTLAPNAAVWTEMVTADAVIHGDRDRLLGFDAREHPVVLQLGGSDPAKMAEAAQIGAEWGYDEVNINCGCPSDRVQSGTFGACLMAEPARVAACVAAMGEAVPVPVTVKCRIAIDDMPARETLFGFVDQVADAGCEVFTVHARKAWLKGLSPKQNRDIPPLDYGLVAELTAARPDLAIILNGGIDSLEAAARHLAVFDGVMLGRAAYQKPAILLGVAALIDAARASGGDEPVPFVAPAVSTGDFVRKVRDYRPYIEAQLAGGVGLHAMTRHMLGLFAGRPGARAWRRYLSEHAPRTGAPISVLDDALAHVAEPAAAVAVNS
ncbi:MAG: tRNA dihydrouridine(20/20a) synthase DusA [Pseudomonadota bacterium]